MLGHLVCVSRDTPPDFGIATWLRHASGGLSLKLQSVIAQLRERPAFAKAPLAHFAKAD